MTRPYSVAVTFVRKRTGLKPFDFVNGQFHARTNGTTVTYFVTEDLARAFMADMVQTYGKGLYSLVLSQVIEARS